MSSCSNLNFWVEFQNYLGNAVPDIIVELCIRSGYDNAISFLDFDDSDVKNIESCAWEKASDLLELSEIYSSHKPTFTFLPGHRKLLLTLPKRISDFKTKKSRKNLFKVSNTEAAKPITEETIELLTEDEINNIKGDLVTRLNKSVSAIGLSANFSECSIVSDIETYISQSLKKTKSASYRCMVQCCSCAKRIPCTHNSSWRISNFESHLKSHAKERQNQENAHTEELNKVLGLKDSDSNINSNK